VYIITRTAHSEALTVSGTGCDVAAVRERARGRARPGLARVAAVGGRRGRGGGP